MIVKWKCLKCERIQLSDTKENNGVDWCKCGMSGFAIRVNTVGAHFFEKNGSINIMHVIS